MSVSSRETSKPGRIVCPVCGSGELRFRWPTLLRFRSSALVECDFCGHNVDEAVLRVLEQIVALCPTPSGTTPANAATLRC